MMGVALAEDPCAGVECAQVRCPKPWKYQAKNEGTNESCCGVCMHPDVKTPEDRSWVANLKAGAVATSTNEHCADVFCPIEDDSLDCGSGKKAAREGGCCAVCQ